MRRDGDGDTCVPDGLWQNAFARAIAGKRGQKILREIERALLEMPERRLLDSHIACGTEVCAVGAYAVWKYQQDHPDLSRKSIIYGLEGEYYDDSESLANTAYLGTELGMPWTMAWELAEANDVRFRDCTPEERWERVLNWVRDRIDRHPLEEAPE